MMDCIDLVELVTDYLEDRLPAAERERFDEHLGICDGCARYVEQIRIVSEMGGAERDAAVSGLAEKLLPAFRTYRRGLQ